MTDEEEKPLPEHPCCNCNAWTVPTMLMYIICIRSVQHCAAVCCASNQHSDPSRYLTHVMPCTNTSAQKTAPTRGTMLEEPTCSSAAAIGSQLANLSTFISRPRRAFVSPSSTSSSIFEIIKVRRADTPSALLYSLWLPVYQLPVLPSWRLPPWSLWEDWRRCCSNKDAHPGLLTKTLQHCF